MGYGFGENCCPCDPDPRCPIERFAGGNCCLPPPCDASPFCYSEIVGVCCPCNDSIYCNPLNENCCKLPPRPPTPVPVAPPTPVPPTPFCYEICYEECNSNSGSKGGSKGGKSGYYEDSCYTVCETVCE